VKAGYVKRFSPVERLLHWVNAIGFFFLLATGLILYLPRLSELVSRRQTIQYIHFWGGVAWLGALAVVVLLGGRRLLATARELDAFDKDDLRWLRRRKAPQGRFNAGQKINAVLTAASLLFALSGCYSARRAGPPFHLRGHKTVHGIARLGGTARRASVSRYPSEHPTRCGGWRRRGRRTGLRSTTDG
jgi:cytochrome b subunit of formate dehydrogenase